MHFHAIILAAMSAGALSASLTAKELTNSKGQPNVKCTGKDNGMNVLIDTKSCPKENPGCNCHLYMPPDGSYVWVDYSTWYAAILELHAIDVFSDTDCQIPLTTVVPSTALVNITDANVDPGSDCVFMGEGVHWGSVMMQEDEYQGNGVYRVDG